MRNYLRRLFAAFLAWNFKRKNRCAICCENFLKGGAFVEFVDKSGAPEWPAPYTHAHVSCRDLRQARLDKATAELRHLCVLLKDKELTPDGFLKRVVIHAMVIGWTDAITVALQVFAPPFESIAPHGPATAAAVLSGPRFPDPWCSSVTTETLNDPGNRVAIAGALKKSGAVRDLTSEERAEIVRATLATPDTSPA